MFLSIIFGTRIIMQEKIVSEQTINKIERADELILVVDRNELFAQGSWLGLKCTEVEKYQDLVRKAGLFKWRSQMEQDTAYKQIIPYMIFQFQDRFFLMQRRANASEARLQSKFSLGIGGHVRQEDMQGNSIFDWALREFHEEVDYKGSLKIEVLGVLNDDRDSVGQVHLGFVLLLRGDCSEISIKSEHKNGFLITAEQADQYIDRMESWSQIVWKSLRKI
jgi:predicted NUDIX family phosphoesterase